MSLLFDLSATQANSDGARHGGGKYGEAIFWKLIEINADFSVCFRFDSELSLEISEALKKNSITSYDTSKRSIAEIIKSSSIRTFYTALPVALIPDIHSIESLDIRVIGTIHGLRDIELWPDWNEYVFCDSFKSVAKFLYKNIFHSRYIRKRKQTIKNLIAAKNFEFATVSQHSKYSLLANFPQMRNETIKVFYSPSTSQGNDFEINANYKRYFLMVSGNRYLKNNDIAIKALDELYTERPDFKYDAFITGTDHSITKRLNLKNPQRFKCFGYVSENELKNLYGNAYCLIYPSLNEGFGYPPIEAMEFGTPVIASPFTSIPEICECAAKYFNPFSKMELKNRILQISSEDEYARVSNASVVQFKKIREMQDISLNELCKWISSNQ